MMLKIICLIILLIPAAAFAGTGTGCSGDQWDDYPAEDVHFVYHTSRLWQIGGSNDGPGCGTVSARNDLKNDVIMENKICAYKFDAKSGKLVIKNVGKAKCECSGEFTLHLECRDGEGSLGN